MSILRFTPQHTALQYRGAIKVSNRIRHAYLIMSMKANYKETTKKNVRSFFESFNIVHGSSSKNIHNTLGEHRTKYPLQISSSKRNNGHTILTDGNLVQALSHSCFRVIINSQLNVALHIHLCAADANKSNSLVSLKLLLVSTHWMTFQHEWTREVKIREHQKHTCWNNSTITTKCKCI